MPALALFCLASPLMAAPAVHIAIRAGTLGDAVLALGQQTGLTIGFTDPMLTGLRTPAISGRMAAERALARLLRGLPARAIPVAGGWRIIAAAVAPHASKLAGSVPRPAAPGAIASDIIVTASKRGVLLRHYPATVETIDGNDLAGVQASEGSDAIVLRLPSVGSTALGPGRNKLFIRGISDSGFNGPSEATAGEYLNDLRLNYNAPDPDLSLIDMQAIQVLEGPQGTLYGAGSLGGIVQLTPVEPQLDRFMLKLGAGLQSTSGGAPGGDAFGLVNVPAFGNLLALRALAYKSIEGGYIDDVARGLRNVNRTTTAGGRAALRIEPGDGWRIRFDGVVQYIDTADGQYAERGLPCLSRSSSLAQPFDNDYALAGVTLSKVFGRIALRSATALIMQDVRSRYDFTSAGDAARVFDQTNRIQLISNETRLDREDSQGVGWVVGISLLHDRERVSRALGPPASTSQILGVDNEVTEIAGYAEGGFRLSPHLVASFGLRGDFAHLVGQPLSSPATKVEEPHRNETRLLPSAALSWVPAPDTAIFLRYQQGFRPGGLSVAGNGNAIDVRRFIGDDISTIEAGARINRLAGGRLDLAATLSSARWRNIQADLVDADGLPFTANVGTGSIYGFEASAAYRPTRAIRVGLSMFADRSALGSPTSAFVAANDRPLPNVAKFGAWASIGFIAPLSGDWTLSGMAQARYFGPSRLGLAPDLAIRQGRYFDSGAKLRLSKGRFGFTIDATNLANARGNRFAFGDPFKVSAGRQYVPLRPRTIRLGFDAEF